MKIHRIVSKRIEQRRDGVSVNADVTAAIAVNVGEPAGATGAHSEQRIVQSSRQTAQTTSKRRPERSAPDG